MARMFAALIVVAALASNSAGEEARTISVEGHGEIKVDPDMAGLALGVTIVDLDVLHAKQQCDKTMSDILELVKTLGIQPDDISVTELHVGPQYGGQNNALVGYETTREITIKLRQLDKLNELLNGCIKAGVNRIDEIELYSSREDELKQKALAVAIADAKERATTIAGGFGTKLGPVRTISAPGGGAISDTLTAPIEGVSSYQPGRIKVIAELAVTFNLQ
jgi:uncharacterized protein